MVRQLRLNAPGVMAFCVALHCLNATCVALVQASIRSVPLVTAVYPVTPVGSLAKLQLTTSVLAVPAAVAVWAVAHCLEGMLAVARARVPLARIPVPLPLAAVPGCDSIWRLTPSYIVSTTCPVRMSLATRSVVMLPVTFLSVFAPRLLRFHVAAPVLAALATKV